MGQHLVLIKHLFLFFDVPKHFCVQYFSYKRLKTYTCLKLSDGKKKGTLYVKRFKDFDLNVFLFIGICVFFYPSLYIYCMYNLD